MVLTEVANFNNRSLKYCTYAQHMIEPNNDINRTNYNNRSLKYCTYAQHRYDRT